MFKYENYKTESSMETIMNQISIHLRMLQAEAPQEAFYMNQRTRTTDNYCKECRKANTRRHRNQDKIYHLKTNLFLIR